MTERRKLYRRVGACLIEVEVVRSGADIMVHQESSSPQPQEWVSDAPKSRLNRSWRWL
jgi:hypothetical protein